MSKSTRTPEQRIAEYRRRIARIEAEAAKPKRGTQAYRDWNRKKYLVGAVIMGVYEKDSKLKAAVMKLLDKHLTRVADRQLFGLEVSGSGDATETSVSASEDPLVAAQRLAPNSADHGDPAKVVGQNAREGSKNSPEGPKLEQGGLWDRAKEMLSK